MLEHLRQRVMQVLASVSAVTLSTNGPAGLQAGRVPCETSGIELFVMIPRTSDHLLNLESGSAVVVVNETWNMSGLAHVVPRTDYPNYLSLVRSPEVQWSEIVEIHPNRLNILRPGTNSPVETIDIN